MKINLTKTFKNCVAAVPSCAMIVGGGLMAVDGMRYGRVDVAAGGAALCGIGMELFGLYKNNNRILGIFNHNSEGFWCAGQSHGHFGSDGVCVFRRRGASLSYGALR